jgi:23S rRNA (adenine2503-C2)-methyltransferase
MRVRDPLGMSPADWESLVRDWGLPRYRARQIFEGIHHRQARDYSRLTELPGALRERLGRELPIRLPEVARRQEAADGSIKLGLRLEDGALVEAVFMPGEQSESWANEFSDARATPESGTRSTKWAGSRSGVRTPKFTVCLSSQTGCAVDCAFCVTGRLGAGRNLTAGEIVGQLHAVLDETNRSAEGMRIVFMGMGEPFLNSENVLRALDVLFEIVSPRRVTVSTSGITPAVATFAAAARRPNLAVSLNAADETVRGRLMPITRTHPIDGLIRAMRAWPLEPRRRILVEYVLIAGVNDSTGDAAKLARLLRGLPVKVNVIPLNEDPVYLPGWKRPDEKTIESFVRALVHAHLTVTVRRSKGPDASAACGQLKGRTEDPRRARLKPAGTS